MEHTVYILSCDTVERGGGVYRCAIQDNGELRQNAYYPCDRPMYAVFDRDRLLVLLRQPFSDNQESGIFTLSPDLDCPTAILTTKGKCACHLCADNDVYVANYLSGNIVKIGDKAVFHSGNGVNPVRQDMPHTHCAFFSPDKQYVLCCDLGLDTLFCYDRALNLVSTAKVSDGDGIRHAVFSRDGKYIYAVSEMVPAVYVFSFDKGALAVINRILIPCENPMADGAAIRLAEDGTCLYISSRNENAIYVYDVDTERVSLRQKADCGGDSPRDFHIIGNYLVVTNEKSNNVVVFSLKNHMIEARLGEAKYSHPLCCVKGSY